MTNLEHFQVACGELERSLTNLRYAIHPPVRLLCSLSVIRSAQRGGTIKLTASNSFESTLSQALARINSVINSKLNDFFELSEYDWTPPRRDNSPSMYLYELISWLTTVVDSLVIKETYKDEAYRGAVTYISDSLMVSSHCWRWESGTDYR